MGKLVASSGFHKGKVFFLNPMKVQRRKAAFTLLEVLIAMLILLVGSTSICALWIGAIDLHKRALDKERVATLADSILAEMQSGDWKERLAKGRWESTKYFPGYSIVIDTTPLPNHSLFLQLTISYKRYGRMRRQVFHTVLWKEQ